MYIASYALFIDNRYYAMLPQRTHKNNIQNNKLSTGIAREFTVLSGSLKTLEVHNS